MIALALVSGASLRTSAVASSGARVSTDVVLTPAPAEMGGSFSPSASPSASVSPSPSASPSVTTLKVGWLGGPESVNPLDAYSMQARLVVHLTHDLLTGYRAEDLGPQPELATGWSHSEDGREWTFTIRSGAVWPDGASVTANDVAFTYNWVLDNEVAPYAAVLAGVTSVAATDERTVVVSCSEPKADMLSLWIPVLPEHLLSEPLTGDETPIRDLAETGSGPFRVVDFRPGELVRLRANESYWRGASSVEELDFISYDDPEAMARDLSSGVLDACAGLPTARIRELRRDPALQVVAAPGRSFVDIGFTCAPSAESANPAQRNPLFRQALDWAVDRRRIVASVFDGFATPGSTIVVPGVRRDPDYHYEPSATERRGYDLDKAAQLLTDAGYIKLAGRLVDTDREPVRLRLYASGSPAQARQIARIVAPALRKLGITVAYESLHEASMRARLDMTFDGLPMPDADLFVSDWVGDADPMFILSVLTSGQIGSWNDTGWTDGEYDQLYAQQAATLDPEDRKGLVDQLQQIAYEQSPYIVIAYPQSLEAERTDRWQGWVQAPAGTGSALLSADNIDTYLHVRPKVGAEPQRAAVVWWVWPALLATGLAGAGLAWVGSRLKAALGGDRDHAT